MIRKFADYFGWTRAYLQLTFDIGKANGKARRLRTPDEPPMSGKRRERERGCP